MAHFSQILRYKRYNTSSEVLFSVQITGTPLNIAEPFLSYAHSWQAYF